MRIAVYGREFAQESRVYIQELFKELKNAGVELVIFSKYLNKLSQGLGQSFDGHVLFQNHKELLDLNVDVLLTIGGDGTILDASTIVRDSNIPVLGVNTGRLGFMANISKHDIKNNIEQLVKGEYLIQERTMVSLESGYDCPDNLNFALNEVTINRKDTTSMITIETYINDEYLNTYWADGLIISTPTGSTGYSLSCGGPIVMPGTENFVITPIAPHNLTVRPLVISDKYKIRLVIHGREDQFLMSMDSRIHSLDSGSELVIKKADFSIRMIETFSQGFANTLRNKLLWGLDRRN